MHGSIPTTPASLTWPARRACWGQREGRTSQSVVDWLQEQTPQFRDAILFVAIDQAVCTKAVRTVPPDRTRLLLRTPVWSLITSVW